MSGASTQVQATMKEPTKALGEKNLLSARAAHQKTMTNFHSERKQGFKMDFV